MNAAPVPVFTGKKVLSLAELECLANGVRDAQMKIGSVGGGGHHGSARAGNAWYVPGTSSPVEKKSVQHAGLINGATFSGRFATCVIEDGMLWLPHAHVETTMNDETGEIASVLPYAGGVCGIEPRAGTPATLDNGHVVLPLAEYPDEDPEMTEGEEENPNLPPVAWPGLVADLSFVGGLPRPCFVQGHGLLPLAHSPNSAVDANASAVAGGIYGIRTNASISSPQIDHGVIEIPLYGVIDPGGDVVVPVVPNAQFGPAVVDILGMVGGMEIVSGITEPEARDGLVRFPLAHCQCYGAGHVACVPGALRGVEYTTRISAPVITDGLLEIPEPPPQTSYLFDPEWFDVSEDGEVTIKSEALATVAEELAAEMAVEVTGTGVLEETFAGTLKANTAGTLTLNTTVTY